MKPIMPIFALLAAAGGAAMLFAQQPAGAASATLYKNPNCGCCSQYAEHLKENGIEVVIEETMDLDAIKAAHGIPEELAACHTVVFDGYAVEGHVPAHVVQRMLSDRPDIDAITLPGMPSGSPGMPGMKMEPFTIHAVSDGESTVYAVE